MARAENADRTLDDLLRGLDLLRERGAGLVVVVTDHIIDGHDVVQTLGERWGAIAVSAERAFQPAAEEPTVVWDLPFLDMQSRHGALLRLNLSRDRLASLAAPVVLWVLDDDLPLCWRAAQDLMDWAAEIVHWPRSGTRHPLQQPLVHLPPPSAPSARLSAAAIPYKWTAWTMLGTPGARCWIEVGGTNLLHTALGLGEFLVDHGAERGGVVVFDLERADDVRMTQWLRMVDGVVLLIAVGAFVSAESLPSRLSAAVLMQECIHPPKQWRRLDGAISRLTIPQEVPLFVATTTMPHERVSAIEYRLDTTWSIGPTTSLTEFPLAHQISSVHRGHASIIIDTGTTDKEWHGR